MINQESINRRIARFDRYRENEKPRTIKQIQTGGGVSVGGGSAPAVAVYVKIIEGLKYDTAEEEGQSAYVCRIVGSGEPNIFDGLKQDYSIGDDCTFDGRIYITTEGYKWSGVVEGEEITPAPNPPDDPDNWVVSDELDVYVWGEPATVPDMRQYLPILIKDEIYPVRKRRVAVEDIDKYFWEIGFTYIGAPGHRSISWDLATDRAMACVSDTVPST